MLILGIDPGYDRIGIALVSPQTERGRDHVIFSSCIRTRATESFEERILDMSQQLKAILKEHPISIAGIEELYFSKNTKTALKVSEARGALLLTLMQHGIPVYSLPPSHIKIAITGNGRATKDDIAHMIPRICSGISGKKIDDEIDAIAIAITTRIHCGKQGHIPLAK
jgi:crossover junction endodeoxyribonuclease RuvC